jgi:hypothetical protein
LLDVFDAATGKPTWLEDGARAAVEVVALTVV